MKPALRLPEACAALGVSVSAFYRAAERGEDYAVYLLKRGMGGGKGRPRAWRPEVVERAVQMREGAHV